MFEARYNKNTFEVTGLWSSRLGNHEAKLYNRPDEDIATLDGAFPATPPESWLFDETSQALVPNPSWIDPSLPSPDYLRACELLAQSPPAITMPEIWELLRIIGRSLGYRFEE